MITRWATGALALALLSAVMLAACGVPLDTAPRAINRTTTTLPSQTTVALSEEATAPKVHLYFLNDGRLEAINVAVEADPDLAKAIGLVLATKPDPPFQTRIPPGTNLLGLRVEGSVATIDLSDAIEDISGPTQKEAYAQIVFTALEFTQITSVQFQVQGQQVDAPTDNSNLAVVTAEDYAPPLNPR